MCHKTCLSCLTQSFNTCNICLGTNILYQSACYCQYPWNPDCTSQTSMQGIFRAFQSFYILTFILILILYCLKVKLPLTYRVVNGLQIMSCILYSKTLYLDYQDFFVLRFFNLLSGPFQIDYRLQSLSTNHAIQTYILLGFFIFLLIILYYPSKIFHKKSQSFFSYLNQNILEYFQNFYYFGGKMMFLYIGMFIQATSKQLVLIIHMVLFCILIGIVIIRLVLEYHKNSLSQQIYQGPLYIYAMLSNVAMIGIPLVSQSNMLMIIYLAPLGLLVLIAILNKDMKILDRNTIKFCVIELIMAGLSVAVIITNDLIRTYILLIVLGLSAIIILVQMSLTYYGGINLNPQNSQKTSNRIQPIMNQSINQIQNQSKKSIQLQQFSQNNKKKGKYF